MNLRENHDLLFEIIVEYWTPGKVGFALTNWLKYPNNKTRDMAGVSRNDTSIVDSISLLLSKRSRINSVLQENLYDIPLETIPGRTSLTYEGKLPAYSYDTKEYYSYDYLGNKLKDYYRQSGFFVSMITYPVERAQSFWISLVPEPDILWNVSGIKVISLFGTQAPAAPAAPAIAAAPKPPIPAVVSSECKICLGDPDDHVLVPCGHTICKTCSKGMKKCPYCRVKVNSVVRIFRP